MAETNKPQGTKTPLAAEAAAAKLAQECTAPGSLDNRLRYAACLKVCSSHAARASSGLRWPFFSISHSAL
jgi:hypothetical protein